MNNSPNAESLEARCQLNYRDVAALRRIASTHAETRSKNTINGLVFLVMTFSPIYVLYAPIFFPEMRAPATSSWPGVLNIAIPLLVFAFGLFYIALIMMRARKDQQNFSKDICIALTETDVTSQTETSIQTVKWRGLLLVVATKDHLCLFTARNEGFVVPRRAFDSEGDWQRFADFALEHWQRTQPAVPPIANA